ncbi:MAG TPA: DNA polymerase III subunit beta [Micromonosporaceae bacterium]
MPVDRLDLTARTAPLADAAARLHRFLPARSLQPALAGVLLQADADGLLMAASDGEQSARMRVPVSVHTAGEVVVSRRGLAETLAALDAYDVRIVAEGSRLALRTPTGRFALPQLDLTMCPRPAGLPPLVGTVTGSALRAAVVPVAGAASRETALPIFTGIRVRAGADRLSLRATDRFRLAAASLCWEPADPAATVASLIPAALFAEAARQAADADRVDLYADADRFAIGWGSGVVVTAALANPFPDRQLEQLLDVAAESVVELEPDALAAAVQRAVPYAGPHGRVTLEVRDGAVIVRGTDPVAGESEETVKADTAGDHLTRCYQARLLLDALRPFPGAVRLEIQAGLRATALSAVHPGDEDLRYLVVPMRTDPAA